MIKKPLFFDKNFNKTWFIFFLIMFLSFLDSFYCYFFWPIPYVIPILSLIFLVCFYFIKRKYFVFSVKNNVSFALFFIAMVYTLRHYSILGFMATCTPFMSLYLFFNLKDCYKAKFMVSLTNSLSVLLFISLTAWFLVLCGIVLPSCLISYEMAGYTQVLNNFYFFIEYRDNVIFQRFMSVFIEPGYLGSLLAMLIFINDFDLKRKEIFILFVALIFTFSISGYLMLIVSYFSFAIKKRIVFTSVVLLCIFVFLSYNVFNKLNNGENVVNVLILSRFLIDDSGKLTGNNRTSVELDYNFEKFMNSGNMTTGIGLYDIDTYGGGVGYKAYMIMHGVIGVILLIFAYLSSWIYRRNRYSITIVLLFILMFLKGHSEVYWTGFLMIYSCSVNLSDNWRSTYQSDAN
jgi:hypothetical protein